MLNTSAIQQQAREQAYTLGAALTAGKTICICCILGRRLSVINTSILSTLLQCLNNLHSVSNYVERVATIIAFSRCKLLHVELLLITFTYYSCGLLMLGVKYIWMSSTLVDIWLYSLLHEASFHFIQWSKILILCLLHGKPYIYISRESQTTRNVYWSRASLCVSVCLSVIYDPIIHKQFAQRTTRFKRL